MKRVSEILLDDAYLRVSGVDKVDVDLRALLGDTIKRLHPCAKNAGVPLTLEGGPCTVKGDAILLGVLFSNLIENAVKACTEGGKVEVVLHADQERPLVTVADNGRGMTKEQLARITEPFYRVDRARSRADGGTGLGLALCKTICTSHGAELSFMSAPGAGTEVSVKFS